MPFAVDEEKFRTRLSLDLSQPQNPATGIPMKQIPHADFPRVVYKHPTQPFRTILHRNTKQEVVREEVVPTEHLTKSVADEKELAQALKEGWSKKPYIAQAPPDANEDLYGTPRTDK